MKNLITVLYYTANREQPEFEEKIIANLLKQCGDLPIISVSQKPLNLGKNICVGDVGFANYNAKRQILIGAKMAKTPFIIFAESDYLYPHEYFTFIPPKKGLFVYDNLQIVYQDARIAGSFRKKLWCEGAQIADRSLIIQSFERYFKNKPMWIKENDIARVYGEVEDIPFEFFTGKIACVAFKTEHGMDKYTGTVNTPGKDNFQTTLPYWGNVSALRTKYFSYDMKNLMIYLNPTHNFDEECKVAVKIQIDNSLNLGWDREDIILITNFPYEYNGVKAMVVGDENYCEHWPWSTKTYVTYYLFKHNLIEEGKIYWAHDMDVFQNEAITRSEIESEMGDFGMTDRGINPKWAMGSIFFKYSAKDIFEYMFDSMDKFKIDEETAIWILTGHDGGLDSEKTKLVNGYLQTNSSEVNSFKERVKKINFTYNFAGWDHQKCYQISNKPIKAVHFHFTIDLDLDAYMYGKNSIHKRLMNERLIEIFHKHGVKGVPLKTMKNLMIYISSEKKFTEESQDLIKKQIDNSLNLGWKKEDIVLVSNFPFEYQGVKAMVLPDSVFAGISDKVYKSHVIFYLLTQELVKEAELWWYHDLDVFQTCQIESPVIDLADTTAGFMLDASEKLDTSNFFFRKASHKLFEWMRNRTIKLNTDEKTAFMSLTEPNYRNINSLYKKLDITDFSERL